MNKTKPNKSKRNVRRKRDEIDIAEENETEIVIADDAADRTRDLETKVVVDVGATQGARAKAVNRPHRAIAKAAIEVENVNAGVITAVTRTKVSKIGLVNNTAHKKKTLLRTRMKARKLSLPR